MTACSGFRQWGLRSKASATVIQKVCPALCSHNQTIMCHAARGEGGGGEKEKSSGMHNMSFSHVLPFKKRSLNSQSAEWVHKHQMMFSGLYTPSSSGI